MPEGDWLEFNYSLTHAYIYIYIHIVFTFVYFTKLQTQAKLVLLQQFVQSFLYFSGVQRMSESKSE